MAEKKVAPKKRASTKTPKAKTAAEKEPEAFKVRVIDGKLNVRKAPGLDGKFLKTLPDGTVVEVLEEKNGWYRIEEGWIMAKFTEKNVEA